ncbi:MAG: SLC13 family permease [Planctomycetaceae bacterium]
MMQSAAGVDAGDALWRYTLKQPSSWLEESYDDVKWQEGRGGFGTTDHATGRVFTEWTSSEIWLRQIMTLKSIPANAALYVETPGETEIFINGSLAAKIDSALEKHAVIPLSPEAISALREGKNIVAVHAKAADTIVPHCLDVHLISADSIPELVPFTTWDRIKSVYPMWLTILVTLLVLIALAYEKPADMVFAGAIVILSLCGVITAQEAFGGFVSQSVLMVAALFLVTAGLKETGIVDMIGARVLGPARTELGGLIMLSLFCVITSAFLNNTPIVAMLIPVVMSWCRRQRVAPSKLLIPLSFMTILGGCCSRIGTSTNLVVDGQMTKYGMVEMGFFEIAWAGVPCAMIGLIYMLTIGRKLLPERKELLEQLGDSRANILWKCW